MSTRPDALEDLITELLEDPPRGEAVAVKANGYVRVTMEDEDNEFDLKAEEARLLFQSPKVIRRLHDALGAPDECTLSLHSISPQPPIMAALQSWFCVTSDS